MVNKKVEEGSKKSGFSANETASIIAKGHKQNNIKKIEPKKINIFFNFFSFIALLP